MRAACFVQRSYLKSEADTVAAIDADGWLHSGDQGEIDADGFVKITGRLKELIVTAGGENVSPVPIENKVMELCPLIANCVVVGDKRKFLSCLVSLKTEVNPLTGEPSQQLAKSVVEFLRGKGSKATTVEEAKEDEVVKKMKRNVVHQHYEKDIESMYTETQDCGICCQNTHPFNKHSMYNKQKTATTLQLSYSLSR